MSGQFIRQEVEAVARYVPQGQGYPSSEEASESLLLQYDGDTVNWPSVALCRPLALQPHLHQVYRSTNRHLKAGRFRSRVRKLHVEGPNLVTFSIFIKNRHWVSVWLQPKTPNQVIIYSALVNRWLWFTLQLTRWRYYCCWLLCLSNITLWRLC